MTKIIPCLWFDKEAREAAEFYASVLPDTHIKESVGAAADYPSGSKGDELLVEMSIMGQAVTLLNGGPHFHHSEAFSFQIFCEDQAEVDRYWDALSAHPENEQCGWVKDKFGLSWQITPTRLVELLRSTDPATSERVMKAMLGMKKLDIAALEAAAAG